MMEVCLQCPLCGCYFAIHGEWKVVKIDEVGDIYWHAHFDMKGSDHRCTRAKVPVVM